MFLLNMGHFKSLAVWFVLFQLCWIEGKAKEIIQKNVPLSSDSVMGVYKTAAVTSDGEPCSKVGKDILKANGTAVDGAIAVQFCLGVTVAESMGIGGGFFATYYHKETKKVIILDCREYAPSGASQNMYEGKRELSDFGGSAVAVPGASRCYWDLYQKYGGGVPWRNLIAPAITLCEEGFPVSEHMAVSLANMKQRILKEPSMSDFVNRETGDVWLQGDILKQATLGKTLRILQEEPDALHSGSLLDSYYKDLKDHGSTISREDLKNYKPLWKEPIKIVLQNGNFSVYSPPPPSSGAIFSFILNILDNYNFNAESLNEKNIFTTYQRIVEAFKHAYGRRTQLGDEDFVDVKQIIRDLQSENYANEVFTSISSTYTSSDPRYYGGVTYEVEDAGTSNMAILDPFGNALVLTSTINMYFGAVITSPSTGIVLNDEMGDFSSPNIINSFGLHPSPANFIKPGKRPLSSMCPAIVIDANNEVVLLTGAAGGSRITSSTAWQTMNYLWLGRNLKESLDDRRLHHQLLPMVVQYETDFRSDVVANLKEIGHNVAELPSSAVITSISKDNNGTIYAMSDFRKTSSCTDGF